MPIWSSRWSLGLVIAVVALLVPRSSVAKRVKPGPVAPAALAEGIARALDNAALLVRESRALLNAGFEAHAGFMLFHALEEFGKAGVLKDGKDRGSAVKRGRDDPFMHHVKKWKRAREHVSDECMTLRRGIFDPAIFDPQIFDVGTLADWEARLNLLYVDWDESRAIWRTAPLVDVADLRASLECVEGVITAKRAEWIATPTGDEASQKAESPQA